jgi:hypothetical protein
MSLYTAYLLILTIVPFAVRLKWDQRAAMAAVIAGLALVLAMSILTLLASLFAAGIWPHTEGGGNLFFETVLYFWSAVAIPALAALAGGALAVLWTMCVGFAHYAVGGWLQRRKKRIALGSKGY